MGYCKYSKICMCYCQSSYVCNKLPTNYCGHRREFDKLSKEKIKNLKKAVRKMIKLIVASKKTTILKLNFNKI